MESRREKGESIFPQLNDRDWLYQKYWIEKLSSEEIAKIVGCNSSAVLRALRRLDIPRRTNSEAKKGKLHPLWGKHRTEETKKKMSNAHKGKHGLKGNENPMFGKHPSEETKGKMSEAKRGERNHNFGKSRSEETKRKISESERGKKVSEATKKKQSEIGKKRCESKEEREKLSRMREKVRMPRHHTKPELIFEEICKKHNLPFHYVGDGQLWIGKRKKLNPDFIEANGKKICIEIFGDYWHSLLLNPKLREDATLSYRKGHYKKYGWTSIFLWENDLKRADTEQFVLSVLKKNKIMPLSSPYYP